MELSRIIINETHDEQLIVLKETDGDRAFPIVIGMYEAVTIDRNIKGKKTPRPMTHDLLEHVIHHLDANLERIVVTDLRDSTFFAKLILRRNGESLEVDSRPSDAIALAIQMEAPIYVEESVLEAITPEGNFPGFPPSFFSPDEDEEPDEEPDEDDMV
jgi:bifunctional DNase/RNase